MDDGIPEFDFSDLIAKANLEKSDDLEESHIVSNDDREVKYDTPELINPVRYDNIEAELSHLSKDAAVRESPLRTSLNTKKRDPHIVHLLKRISLQSTILCIIIPLFSLFKIILSRPRGTTPLFLYAFGTYMIISQIGFFGGYHRFFAHQSFQAHLGLQLVFAIFGGSCGLGSILQFTGQHLAHHRHQDTERDPHSYSVYGWLFSIWGHRFFLGNRKSRMAIQECKDTFLSTSKMVHDKLERSENDKDNWIQPPNHAILKWQEENYIFLLISTLIVVPAIVARYCQVPVWTGIYYLGFVRMSIIQQQWLLLGTLCHIKNFPFATQPFSNVRSAVNLPLSFFWQFLLFGEANHNFHHEFPSDYTSGSRWYHWDPSKWIIWSLYQVGMLNRLHATGNEQLKKCVLQQQQKLLDQEISKLKWGIPIEKLPIITPDQFSELAKRQFTERKRALVVIEGIVHDVTPFIHNHPGGTALVQLSIGKDATQAFNGAVYSHSQAARNLLATMRIAVLSSNEQIKQTVWERRMLQQSQDNQWRNNRQVTYTQKNHYAAGAA